MLMRKKSSVHPRRRGEHRIRKSSRKIILGSSPQARGTRQICFWRRRYPRFIPAGAGNTGVPRSRRSRRAVHPRRRGEHTIPFDNALVIDGSSPQARGTLQTKISPCLVRRFIPAGAGNTSVSDSFSFAFSVHPRRRGEHQKHTRRTPRQSGSSPQARGTPVQTMSEPMKARFIPAGAGNTAASDRTEWARAVHPRRRGEHGGVWGGYQITNGSSPQARGTRSLLLSRGIHHRFIPAGAGNTTWRMVVSEFAPVHPRRRGEHSSAPFAVEHRLGSSPQARGTLYNVTKLSQRIRFIPAGAGNTPGATSSTRENGGSSPQARGTRASL